MITSALYTGTLVHARKAPARHRFRRRIAMPLLMLDELPRLRLGPVFSSRHPAPVHFRHGDFLSEADVRKEVERLTGTAPLGRIGVLASVRTWGWLFNPLTLYFCFSSDGATVTAVLLEVTNTPWKERVRYAVRGEGDVLRADLFKEMHVSPFLPMDVRYRIRVGAPGGRLNVAITVVSAGGVVVRTALALQRRPLTRRHLLWHLLVRHPFMTHRISAGIYREAWALWRKGVPFHGHPPSDRGLRQAVRP